MSYPAAIARVAMMLALLVTPWAAIADEFITNSDVEAGQDVEPEGWLRARIPAEGLRMQRSNEQSRSGDWSLEIDNRHDYGRRVSNNWYQKIERQRAGTTIQLTASIRTSDVSACNVCIQCWSSQQKLIGFVSTRIVRGTLDWTEIKSEPLVIPHDTKEIIVRAALTGTGRVWFDNIRLRANGGSDDPETPNLDRDDDQIAESLSSKFKERLVRVVPMKKDCMVLAYMRQWNHGYVDNIAVSNHSGGVRTLLDWESIEPDLALNENYRFLLAMHARRTTAGQSPGNLVIRELAEEWQEESSFATQPAERADGIMVRREFKTGRGWQLFDITPIVRHRVKQDARHFGVVLRFEHERPSGEGESDRSSARVSDEWSGYSFVSREGVGLWTAYRPAILVVEKDAKK